MKQNVYKQAMQIRVDTYTIWKGKEAHLRIFFISIVENLVNAYQNIIFIQPFKGVVILLARKICS